MGSIVDHRIDDNGVGALRKQAAHTQQKLTQVPPSPRQGTPVAVGTALRAEANRSEEGTQKQLHFLLSLGISFSGKMQRAFH